MVKKLGKDLAAFIEWNDYYKVKNPVIDRQHKIIFSSINDLYNAMQESKEGEILEDILFGMKEYTETHFADEENIMRLCGYPFIQEHINTHENFSKKVNEIYYKGVRDRETCQEVLTLLKNWWIEHIGKADKTYIPYLVNIDTSKITEDELLDLEIFNLGLKEVDFTQEQISLLQKIAKVFDKYQKEIVANWAEIEIDNCRRFPILREGIEMLMEDFAECLSAGRISDYFNKNEIMAKKIASHDVPYAIFIKTFHHWENSYSAFLESRTSNKSLEVNHLLDYLHHNTISILANEYFRMRDTTIFAMARLSESRDPETGHHLLRTREYSKLLAQCLGCRQTFIENIYLTSPLHDIGKVGIKDSILLKPGPLTSEEFDIMKGHTEIGAHTLKDVRGKYRKARGYLLMAEEIAHQHHEKWDGSGYPQGLIAEEISLSARIFMVADIYDALVSKRCYKKPFSHDTACSYLIKGDPSGRIKQAHFDPKIIGAFVTSKDQFNIIGQMFSD